MKLLISYHTGFTGEQLQKLESMGFELTMTDRMREEEPCPEELMDAEAVICYRLFCANDITRFKSLRLIQTTSAGIDHMPLKYIREKGIKLYNATGVYSVPIAEFALCGVLQLYKRAPVFREQQTRHVWRVDREMLELGGKSVCIVGAGSIGSETAKRFSAMGCRVTGLCRHPHPEAYFDAVLPMESLDDVLEKSDIVILAVPLDDSTRGLFGAKRFGKMKPGAVFVNVARGQIADDRALCDALRSGRLMGAVVDVCENEPLYPESPLWDIKNCIITPHNSFMGDGNNDRLFKLVVKNFSDYLCI